MKDGRLRIVVGGMVAGDPHQGGATWAVAQYLLGLRRLGHDVMLVEPVRSPPERVVTEYFDDVRAAFSLEDRAGLLVAGSHDTFGIDYARMRAFARDADLLLNVAGMITDPDLLDSIPVRVYLDLDPAFTQLWHVAEGIDMRFDAHTHFATVGLGVGSTSDIPTCGRQWLPTVPPVVLDQWPRAEAVTRNAFTTIANWRGYGSVEYGGVKYGQKAHSVRTLIDLPTRTDASFELALDIDPGDAADIDSLSRNGWRLLDPREAAGTPAAYKQFVSGSFAEIGIAKSGYVLSRSGWISDRSVCYLAAGRPVVAQETGVSNHIRTGEGLITFTDTDSASAAAEDVRSRYRAHSDAARELAASLFASDTVLASLLERTAC